MVGGVRAAGRAVGAGFGHGLKLRRRSGVAVAYLFRQVAVGYGVATTSGIIAFAVLEIPFQGCAGNSTVLEIPFQGCAGNSTFVCVVTGSTVG